MIAGRSLGGGDGNLILSNYFFVNRGDKRTNVGFDHNYFSRFSHEHTIFRKKLRSPDQNMVETSHRYITVGNSK